MQIDRRHFIASLGGAAAVKLMSHEAKAEALEAYMIQQLNPAASQAAPKKFPTAADIEAQIETRSYRRGVGNLVPDNPAGRQSEEACADAGEANAGRLSSSSVYRDFQSLSSKRESRHEEQDDLTKSSSPACCTTRFRKS